MVAIAGRVKFAAVLLSMRLNRCVLWHPRLNPKQLVSVMLKDDGMKVTEQAWSSWL